MVDSPLSEGASMYGAADLEAERGREGAEHRRRSRSAIAALASSAAAMLLVVLLARGSRPAMAPVQTANTRLETRDVSHLNTMLAALHRQNVERGVAQKLKATGRKQVKAIQQSQAMAQRIAAKLSADADRRSKAIQQSLDESMTQYNSASGLLVTRHYDAGLRMKMYWNADARYNAPDLPKLFKPEALAYLPSMYIVGYSDIQELVAKNLGAGPDDADEALAKINFPSEGDDDAKDLVIIFDGNVAVKTEGQYTFVLDANEGAVLNVTDPNNGATLELVSDGTGNATGTLNLTEGVTEVYAYWKAVDGVAPRLIVTWSGPGTDDVDVPLQGRHWTDTGPGGPPKGDLEDGDVKHGFGCRFYYYETGLATLPSVEDLLAELPNSAAKMDEINISSHKDLWFFAGEEDEVDIAQYQVAAMCMGLVKVVKPGKYQFDTTHDDGFALMVDGILVQNNTAEVDVCETDTEGMKLPAGYHEVIVTWYMNTVSGQTPYDVQTGGQVLVPMYRGPDTGAEIGSDAAATPAGPVVDASTGLLTWTPLSMPGGELRALLLNGFYLPKGFGDIKGLELKGGKTVKGHLLGYSASKGKFKKERSSLENFDKDWLKDNKDHKWKKYDMSSTTTDDYKKEFSKPAGAIIKPWTDWSKAAYKYGHDPTKRLPVPDKVYTKDPPYDPEVVDLGGKGIGWEHNEGQIGDDVETVNGEAAVMGQKYQFPDKGWSKTINSVPDELTGGGSPGGILEGAAGDDDGGDGGEDDAAATR